MTDHRRHHRFLDVSAELLAQGVSVRFRAAGASMRPSILDGDLLTVAPACGSRLEPGALAVYRAGNRLFVHRLVAIEAGPTGSPVMIFRGDAATDCDAPVTPDQVLGEIVGVERGPRVRRLVARVRAVTAAPFRTLADSAQGAYLALTRRISFS